ncbi:unnamed protein product [Musa acuminata var. zebrina]
MAIDAWRRGRIVGRGASATVSVAASLSSGEIFAVKSAELSSSEDLQREQRILSSLDSPYVVSYFGFEVGLCYDLFMEYAPGGSMSDEIKKRGGRLDELNIRSYTCDLLRGLAYLHSNGVVHCDLKSQNVLICSVGRAKIADFGCARRADEEDKDGGGRVQPRGTPMFMAPEVARGEEQSASADVWALGCTVIEMATGQPPWPHASDPVSALHRIAFSAAVPEFPCWLSEDGNDFLSRCLRRDPRERWSAEQLLRHPFVASWTSNPLDYRWVSPKSTLDQEFWSALSEEEEEEDEESLEQPAEDASERMQSLLGITPNWTWGEDWVTVRSDGRDRSVDEVTRGSEAFTDVSVTSNSEEFVFSTNHTEGSSDRAIIKANCNVNDTSHVEIAEGIKDQLALICECVRMCI